MTRRRFLGGVGGGAAGFVFGQSRRAAAEAPLGAPSGYSIEDYNALLTADPGPLDVAFGPGDIEGEIPPGLLGGTYLLNGPARVALAGRVMHPFDGHGFVRAFAFTGPERVDLKARFVQTESFIAEDAAQRLVYRGLGTLPVDPGGLGWAQNMGAPGAKNVANTTIYSWGERLLAGWEGGLPHRLDPADLHTLGLEDFGGALGAESFLAHVRIDHARGRMVGLSQGMGRETTLTFREFDPEGRVVLERRYVHPRPMFIHDFVITPRFYVLTENPLNIDLGAFVGVKMGRRVLMDALSADTTLPGRVILIPRGPAVEGDVRILDVDGPLFTVHYANAWEQGDALHLALCGFDTLSFGQEFGYQGATQPINPSQTERAPAQRLQHLRIDLRSGALTRIRRGDHALDFPRVHPERDGVRTGVMVAAARAEIGLKDPFNALAVGDLLDPDAPLSLWVPGGGRFVGEPLLAPDPEDPEGPGHVLVLVYDPHRARTQLCILDPGDVEAGPLAAVTIPLLLPYGFHGGWRAA